ncbi:MAG TPA: Asp-tRNA(Asn)/Glu-tRNA(Gln) amidotransferase subunit GatB [Polyangiaceae bacterium]|jgi:aspartyl-tRNA(Asn)/glutamyl-tRNA(Gln) amidotransferase subunit B|nr:Asp-tRNA(Asn)/Glu-tRNA(Gln) amidotransferase subunit GatB [Polyangiaceae bacterium]
MVERFETVIGLEVHAQLLTKSKLFCGCSTSFGNEPNSNVCVTCLGLPGALPATNERAVRLAVRAALALGCTIRTSSIFARKQYFYPDLPKGYQISQYEEPFSEWGHLEVELPSGTRKVTIRRAHMEEDAGKSVHGHGGDSLVDLNRAGTPLVEIVSEPDLRSSEEAAVYLRTLRDILVFAGVNDGNLEEGSFRCDANVSIRPLGSTELGTRTELKNLNSFRYVQKAIDVEAARQAAVISSGGRIIQETRSFDPATGKTASLRSKEDAHDYRYFPDPDLPPLVISEALIEEERRAMPRLPAQLRHEWTAELGLSPSTAQILTQHPGYVRFFEEARQLFPEPVKVANWILTEVLRDTKAHGLDATFPVTPSQVAELLKLVESGDISGKQAKEVHAELVGKPELSPAKVVEQRGMRVVSDEGALLALCQKVVAANPKQTAEYRGGKKTLLGYFVGQAMKETRGSANPKLVSDLMTKVLDGAT